MSIFSMGKSTRRPFIALTVRIADDRHGADGDLSNCERRK